MLHRFICLLSGIALTMLSVSASATDREITEHLRKSVYALDSNAAAVGIYESVTFRITAVNGGHRLLKKVKKVIKICKEQGKGEADVSLPVRSTSKHPADIYDVKAVTYNLLNGEVVKQKMDKSAFSIEKADGNYITGKFSLPNVHSGSVIEYEYTIESDLFTDYGRWSFQEDIPKLYSRVETTFPSYFSISSVETSSVPFEVIEYRQLKHVDSNKLAYIYFTPSVINETTTKTWVRRNIAAKTKEPFTYNIDNYSDKIQLQITGSFRDQQTTWESFNDELLRKTDYFGYLDGYHGKAGEKARAIASVYTDDLSKAKAIYRYVRDSFTVNRGAVAVSEKPSRIFERRIGNHADITLLLTIMLQEAGLNASPLLVSSRENMKMLPEMPFWERINASVVRLQLRDTVLYLDPANRYAPFGRLHPTYYNGLAWVVAKQGRFDTLVPDNIKERQVYSVRSINETRENYEVEIQCYYGRLMSAELRQEWSDDTTNIKKWVVGQLRNANTSLHLISYDVSNLNDADTGLQMTIRAKLDWPEGDAVYFSPCFFKAFAANPFKASRRYYPIELPVPIEVKYALFLKLPDEYKASYIPEPIHLKLTDSEWFKYLIRYTPEDNSLVLTAHFLMGRTFYPTGMYEDIKALIDQSLEVQQKNAILKKKL